MLKFHELGVSPNNTKVRMALRYKGVEFESIPVDPGERSKVLEISGQELTPIIEDRGIVLNDSEAIIQYLDANYEGPRLYPPSRAGRKECDRWKETIDEKVARHWAPPFFFAIKMAEALDEDARREFADALAWLDGELGERSSFKDDPDMAICDLRVAEWATYALPGEGLLERLHLFKNFREVYGVEAGSLPNLERMLAPWNERLA